MTHLAKRPTPHLAALVFLALWACKSSEKAAPGASSGSAAPTSVAPAEGSEKMGTFVCKEFANDACVDETARFPLDAPVVHVSYKTTTIPKSGQVYTMQWIAEDVGTAAKPNTVIATLEKKVEDLPDFGVKSYSVHTQLSKPTAGWPAGKYRVEIKLGDALVTTARFEMAGG
jgi:hypothetical protein